MIKRSYDQQELFEELPVIAGIQFRKKFLGTYVNYVRRILSNNFHLKPHYVVEDLNKSL